MSKKHDHLSIPGVADAKRPIIFPVPMIFPRMKSGCFENDSMPVGWFRNVPHRDHRDFKKGLALGIRKRLTVLLRGAEKLHI